MKIIVAVDANWAIGRKNQLLVRIPEDMRFFQQKTMGQVIVLGRKTLESFPNGRPLPERMHIVLTHCKREAQKNIVFVTDVETLLEQQKQYPEKEIYVVGGAQVYELLLPYCEMAYVTKIQQAYEADTYFPNLDESIEWKIATRSEEHTYYDIEYEFVCYKRTGLYLSEQEEGIFVADTTGKIMAKVTYQENNPGILTVDHTVVDPSLRGQGIAKKLMFALEKKLKRENKQVDPVCTYAKKWFTEQK